MSTQEQLKAERQIIDAATDGPWEVHVERYGSDAGDYHGAHIPGVADQLITEHDGSYPPLSPADAEFIAHARTALPLRNAQVQAVLRALDEYEVPSKQIDVTGEITSGMERLERLIRRAIQEATP